MSRLADEHLKKTLQSKFEDYEVSPEVNAWSGISEQIGSTGITEGIVNKATLGSYLLVFVLAFQQGSVNSNADDVIATHGDGSLIETNYLSTTAVEATPKVMTFKREAGSQTAAITSAKVKESKRMPSTQVESTANTPFVPLTPISSNSETSNIAISASSDQAVPDHAELDFLLARGGYVLTGSNFSNEDLHPSARTIDKTGRVFKVALELINGFSLNYARFQPNPGDSLYIQDRENAFSISPQRIGLEPMLSVKWPLSPRLTLNTTTSLQWRRHRIALDYEEYNNNGELINEVSLSDNVNVLSIGGGAGFSYSVGSFGTPKAIDLDFFYQKRLTDLSNGFVGYGRDLYQVRLGMSYYFNSKSPITWKLNPFINYTLNRKHSASPMQLTPYAVGVAFGVQL